MIITRTPLRISFVGGGTDLPDYFTKHTGQVISTTIDKYVYVTVNRKFDGRVSLRYSETENVARTADLRHTIVRECLHLLGIYEGIEIVTISDVPMNGTGLGSSSTLTVGLLKALGTYIGKEWDLEELARTAYKIEAEILGAPIGLQDQYAAVMGGFNQFVFGGTSIGTEDLYAGRAFLIPGSVVDMEKILWLQKNTMLFCLDKARDTNEILREQAEHIEDRLPIYHAHKKSVWEFLRWLTDDSPCDAVGGIIDKAWQNKKGMCNQISTPSIDTTYEKAMRSGAIGGKIVGAGGGGFLMLIVPEENQVDIRRAMRSALREMPFQFSRKGSEVIYDGR